MKDSILSAPVLQTTSKPSPLVWKKQYNVALIVLLALGLIFMQQVILGAALLFCAMPGRKMYAFYREIEALDFSSDAYEVSLKDIIADMDR